MMTPQKTKELLPVIQAFAEGKCIQYRALPNHPWQTATGNYLNFNEGNEYRIKPETIKYRVALYCDGNGPPWARITNQRNLDKVIERQSEFVRWLTDWIEVEV